jgi:hypothetical protein
MKIFRKDGNYTRKNYPESFEQLINYAKELFPSVESGKRYQIIEANEKNEIATQEDFENMTKKRIGNKVVKIYINIVDKNTKYIKPDLDNVLQRISNESNIIISGINHHKEELNNEDSNTIQEIVKKKLKELEDNLVEQIYQSSMIEIQKSRMEEKNKDNNKIKKRIDPPPIHKGIICNKCGKEIIGERFKCVQCTNFNLCEICENNYNHDIKHIMISIVFPVENEEELNEKIDKNICYKNQNLNYSFEPKIFYFNRERDVQSQEVTIKNIGSEVWRGVWMKCFEDKSDIIGDEYNINYIMNPGDEMKIKIQFFNIKSQLVEGKNIYYSFYQMFNKANETFGDVTKIKIIFDN